MDCSCNMCVEIRDQSHVLQMEQKLSGRGIKSEEKFSRGYMYMQVHVFVHTSQRRVI